MIFAFLQMSFNFANMTLNQQPPTDSSETVIVSTLALLKMYKHCLAGVPVEVMGLLIGKYIDQFTIEVVDCFAMPQKGRSDEVEAVDEEYQQIFLQMLEKVTPDHKIPEVVGWYHSHPSYHCWLSSIDSQTASLFEKLNKRCISIVVDPINSISGQLYIESFRNTNGQSQGLNLVFQKQNETRIITSEEGFIRKKDPVSVKHGNGSKFYQMNIKFNEKDWEKNLSKQLLEQERRTSGKELYNDQNQMLNQLLQATVNKDYLNIEKYGQECIDNSIRLQYQDIIKYECFR